MTEADWNGCTDPQAMLTFLRDSGKLSRRKARLFAAACCRQVLPLTTDDRIEQVVEVVERYADGRARQKERIAAREVALAVAQLPTGHSEMNVAWAADAACHRNAIREAENCMRSASSAAVGAAVGAAPNGTDRAAIRHTALLAIWAAQCSLLRDIIAFRRMDLSPSVRTWNNGLIQRLAEAAYEHRLLPLGHLDPERLAVLSDAMEEVGADAEMVEHLRGPGPHCRGCFVVDFLTGRE